MSSLRRIIAVGLPTAGLTVFTAVALGGTPAAAGPADHAARPVAVVTPCADADRGKCGYGATAPTDTPATGAGTVPTTRGNVGYGTPAASTPPSPAASTPTPAASTAATVPPGVSPSSATPGTGVSVAATPSGGVSAGGALPVTGAPMGTLVSLGG